MQSFVFPWCIYRFEFLKLSYNFICYLRDLGLMLDRLPVALWSGLGLVTCQSFSIVRFYNFSNIIVTGNNTNKRLGEKD